MDIKKLEERGMDIVHNCEECPYQPQVQQIVRTQGYRIRNMSDEELAEMFSKHDSISREKGFLTKQEILEFIQSELKEM